MNEFWVFGYASLIWRPGFAFEERVKGRLIGYHRSLCVQSVHHRGTPEKPGLVFGLDRGGSCVGMAFRVHDKDRDPVVSYLRERELVSNVYHEMHLPVLLADQRRIVATAFVVDRKNAQYAGRPTPEEAAEAVRTAHGKSGPNIEYVLNALDEIRKFGLKDSWLEEVAALL